MTELVVLRALVLAVLAVVCGVVVQGCRRQLDVGPRLALDFTLVLYLLTFFVGSAWLFVYQAAAIDSYFSGAMTAPRVDYGALLALAAAPLLVLPIGAVLATRGFAQGGRAAVPVRPVHTAAVWIGVGIALVIAFAVAGGSMRVLLGNATSDLTSASGLVEIYARRRELFESLSSLQGGVLYGTLPACAALLLFQEGRLRWLNRAVGAAVAALAVLVNAGLFQIGPVLVFGLMCVFCLVARHRNRIRARDLLALGAAGMLLLGGYLSLKTTEREQELGVALQVSMRMPIALPYLFEMAENEPRMLERSDSLPHDLGEYMFPEFAGVERFVAMPQPSFVSAFFSDGVLAALATLLGIVALIVAGGALLQRAMAQGRSQFVAVVLGPTLYYAFQIDLAQVLISSYGAVYVALPVVVALAADGVLQGLRPIAPPVSRDPEPLAPR